MPKLTMPGALIVGDAGGMVDTAALKGVHHCIKSGILAAEAIYKSLKTGESLEPYEKAVEESSIGKELYQVRNTRQAFQKGFVVGSLLAGPAIMSKGKVPPGRQEWHRDDAEPMFIGDTRERYPKPDGKYTFDKLSSVYISGNATRDDAPNHIRVREARPAGDRRDVGVDVPGRACTRSRTRRPERAGGRDRQLHELRAVRGDHGQGRAADAARGRRRAALPGHLSLCLHAPVVPGNNSEEAQTRCVGGSWGARNFAEARLLLTSMSGKRLLLAGVVALAGVCAYTPVVASAAAPPSAQLINPGCHRATLPSARKISVTAVMRPVSGTKSMEMMFDLQRARRRAGPFSSVRGRGLGQWVHPANATLGQRPGDIWKFDQKVSNLPGTAYYRFRVGFRWLSSQRALARDHREPQPGLLPARAPSRSGRALADGGPRLRSAE